MGHHMVTSREPGVLQQGDPMSPYLFVLAMEVLTLILNQFIDQDGGFKYHWRCEDLRLFQLGFADDLLLFSKADLSSVHLFKRGLLEFADLSGLQVNPQKSHIILSRSAAVYRDMLLPILGYQEGHLPLWYLGFPLLASRLTIADCKPILQKIDDRIRGWDGIMLSFAGRLQLIKSVLTALQVYWAMAFILPKSIIREIEKRLRSFLWKGSSGVGYAKVSWQQACRPVEEGGLGLRDLLALNRGLMSRHLWRVIMADRSSIWVDWVIHCRLRNASIWTVSDRTGSWSCRKLGSSPSISETMIIWTGPRNSFSSAVAYDVFCPPGPKVDWYSLLLGSLKIPQHRFILWLAILGRLSTMDKPWLQHLGIECVLCRDGSPETHSHLFFLCPFALECLQRIQMMVHFHWPYCSWDLAIRASTRWRGRHILTASYRALLASLVYHIWEELNHRIFQQTDRTPALIARVIVDEIRDLLLVKTCLTLLVREDCIDLGGSLGLSRVNHIHDPVVVRSVIYY
ncbi:UNVERIFIED_CONTAM: hypothetical protein Sradi_7155400 [Sesamum radiatum]|uniref:Reverse transcriptase domain-containing protein n=1 Tax=Sesamum radiatum TaxID=300843 RepID=A0AAW2IVK8_SESRA